MALGYLSPYILLRSTVPKTPLYDPTRQIFLQDRPGRAIVAVELLTHRWNQALTNVPQFLFVIISPCLRYQLLSIVLTLWVPLE